VDGLLHHQEGTHLCGIDMGCASYMPNELFLDHQEDSPKFGIADLDPFALPKQQNQHRFSELEVEVELQFLLQHDVVLVH
jgi:hypothetical protein